MVIKLHGVNQIKICEKKKEKVVYIDMDGVLTNWMEAASKLFPEVDLEDESIRKKIIDGEKMDELGIISEDELWDKINEAGTEFWSGLDSFTWSRVLVEEMEKIATVYFLTSPGICVFAGTGKMEWIKSFFGEDYLDNLIICRDKFMCAAPNRVLVDDNPKKINKFNEYGGTGFLWPCQFVLEDGYEETIDKLKKIVNSIK